MRIIVIIVSVISLISCGNSSVNERKEDLVEFDSVVDSLTYLISSKGESAELLFQRAKAHEKAGDLDLALADLNKKMSMEKGKDDFYFKGNLLYGMQDFENANNSYRICVTENPGYAKCYLKLAQIKQLLGYYNTALALADSALFIDKTLPEAYFLKGFTFELRQMIGDSSKAISSYQTAVELNPKFYDSYIRLGVLHASKEDSLAISYYQSAIDIQPKRIEGYYNQAIYFQESDLFDRAMINYDKILEIDRGSYLALYNQGYLLLVHANDYKNAREKFNSALSFEPNYIDAYYNRALCSFYLKEYDKSREDCKKTLELDPQHDKAALLMSEMDRL